MFKRLFRRDRNSSKTQTSAQIPAQFPAQFHGLEQRTLFAALVNVTGVVADNRGEALITMSGDLNAATVSRRSVQVYTVGADGLMNTADDLKMLASVRYLASARRIIVQTHGLNAGDGYRVRLVGSRITSAADGQLIDGEFTGTLPSGNGTHGGNFDFLTKNDRTASPSARFSTSGGVITVRLDKTDAPNTVANFMRYANSGRYDGTIIHRDGRTDTVAGPISIIQGGGYASTDLFSGSPSHIKTYPPITLEAVASNLRGTIAMARTSDPNSATSEWFFNQADNTFLNTTGPGTGYAVFGTVRSGIETVDTIFNANTIAPNGFFNAVPQISGQNVVIRRIAILQKIAPLV